MTRENEDGRVCSANAVNQTRVFAHVVQATPCYETTRPGMNINRQFESRDFLLCHQ